WRRRSASMASAISGSTALRTSNISMRLLSSLRPGPGGGPRCRLVTRAAGRRPPRQDRRGAGAGDPAS
ncbi:MAG TPA: hypothetical protein VIK98_08860, partial [Limnochordales bacterium]